MYGTTVPKALAQFADKRPPGIYKHYYVRWAAVCVCCCVCVRACSGWIGPAERPGGPAQRAGRVAGCWRWRRGMPLCLPRPRATHPPSPIINFRPPLPSRTPGSELFKYYHERLPANFPFPAQPPWKAGDSPEHEPAGEEAGQGEGRPHIEHDDVFGEQVRRSGQPCAAARAAAAAMAAPQPPQPRLPAALPLLPSPIPWPTTPYSHPCRSTCPRRVCCGSS